MSVLTDTFMTKFQVKGRPVYVKVNWNPNEYDLFQIQLSDDNCFWSGRFSYEFAQKFQERYENPNEYNNDVKKCLSGEDDCYTFDFGPVSGDADVAKFSWIKKYEGASKTVGSVPLHRVDKGNKSEFMDYLIDENRTMKKMLLELKQKTDTLNKELTQCNNDMQRFIDLKSSVETSLYGRFLQLLNAKKKRIQNLGNELDKVNKSNKNTSDLD